MQSAYFVLIFGVDTSINLKNISLISLHSIKTELQRRDLTQSYNKSPYTHRKFQKAMWQHKNATKKWIW